MFNVLIERGLVFLVTLILLTQIIVPLFIPKLDLFWIFKMKSKPAAPQTGPAVDLDATVETLKHNAIEQSKALKSTIDTVDNSIHKLEEIKRGV